MLVDILELLIGAGGSVLYLYLWRRCLSTRAAGTAGADDARMRQRRRLAQASFFLLATPYVLALFWLLERLRTWLTEPAL